MDNEIFTSTHIRSEDVIALLRERQFVNSMLNETSLEKVARVSTRISTINKAVNVAEQPIDQLGTFGFHNGDTVKVNKESSAETT